MPSGHPIRAGLPDDPNLKSGITLRGTVEDGVGVVTDGELLIHYDRHWEGTNLFFHLNLTTKNSTSPNCFLSFTTNNLTISIVFPKISYEVLRGSKMLTFIHNQASVAKSCHVGGALVIWSLLTML